MVYGAFDPFEKKKLFLHRPLIAIEPRPHKASFLQSLFADLADYTHILFTSKTAVHLFAEALEALRHPKEALLGKQIFAIGPATAEVLRRKKMAVSALAAVATQEGVMQLLRACDLRKAYFFLPQSSIARPRVRRFLQCRGVRHQVCPLYDLLFIAPNPSVHFAHFEQIVFTSPSTVRAFVAHFHQLPAPEKTVAMGPITHECLWRVRRHVEWKKLFAAQESTNSTDYQEVGP